MVWAKCSLVKYLDSGPAMIETGSSLRARVPKSKVRVRPPYCRNRNCGLGWMTCIGYLDSCGFITHRQRWGQESMDHLSPKSRNQPRTWLECRSIELHTTCLRDVPHLPLGKPQLPQYACFDTWYRRFLLECAEKLPKRSLPTRREG